MPPSPLRGPRQTKDESLERYVHFHIAAGISGFYRYGNSVEVEPYDPPDAISKDHNRYLATAKILLVSDSFVSGQQKVETVGFRKLQQVAVRDFVPAAFDRLSDP